MTLDPSLPLGIDPDAEYADQHFTLECGDRLMLHTDGVLEARSGKGELYGFGRLTTLLAGIPDAESIVDAACAFGQEDDITVLTIERLPAGRGRSFGDRKPLSWPRPRLTPKTMNVLGRMLNDLDNVFRKWRLIRLFRPVRALPSRAFAWGKARSLR
jgi:hypothetical protein